MKSVSIYAHDTMVERGVITIEVQTVDARVLDAVERAVKAATDTMFEMADPEELGMTADEYERALDLTWVTVKDGSGQHIA